MAGSSDGRRGYRDREHAADKSIEAWGESLAELFCAAAAGMFSQSAELAEVPRAQEWAVEVSGESAEDLLRAWLSELLWVAEREEATPCGFEIEELTEGPWRLRARAWGGPVGGESPHTGAPVKAVTYHDLHVWQAEGLWKAHVVFDV